MTMRGAKAKAGVSFPHDEVPHPRRVVAVTVSGPVGCGKSAVAGIIEDALKAAGVAVQQDNRLDTERNMRGGDWSKDIAMYEPMATIVERIERSSGQRPERVFYWKWPSDGMAWFAWAFQNYGSKWIVWRVGPLNYRVQVAEPGQNGGWIGRATAEKQSRARR